MYHVRYMHKMAIQFGFEANIHSDISNISNFAKVWFVEISLEKCFYLQIDLDLVLNICIDVHPLFEA